MIPELERYQGIVLRQLVMAHPEGVCIQPVNIAGRADAFALGRAACMIKHSGKRLSPWRFTFQPEHLAELDALRAMYDPVAFLAVCGVDGVVALTSDEVFELLGQSVSAATWLRISRGKNEMYRVGGPLKELERAKARGVEVFVAQARSRGAISK